MSIIQKQEIFDSLQIIGSSFLPIGTDLLSGSNRSFSPSIGAIAYDRTTNQFVYGNGAAWTAPSGGGSTTTLSGSGVGTTLVSQPIGPNLVTKDLLPGTGIALSNDINSITINSTSNITGTGAGTSLISQSSGPNYKTKDLIVGPGLGITDNSNSVTLTNTSTITGSGTGVSLIAQSTTPSFKTKDLIAGTGISISNNATSVTVSSTLSPSPNISRVIFISIGGDDTTGDGSLDNPYKTLSKGISIANVLSSISSPVTIFLNSGEYIENNATGPLSITAQGVAIVSYAINTTVKGNTSTNDLLQSNITVIIRNVYFLSTVSSTGNGLVLGSGRVDNCKISGFNIGLQAYGVGGLEISDSIFEKNAVNVYANNTTIQGSGVSISGDPSSTTPYGTGVLCQGGNGIINLSGGSIKYCDRGAQSSISGVCNLQGVALSHCNSVCYQTSASSITTTGCMFSNIPSSGYNIYASGAGSTHNSIACTFLGDSQGTCVYTLSGGDVIMSSCQIDNYNVALRVGSIPDTSSTVCKISDVNISNCATDIIQRGSSLLSAFGGSFASTKLNIANGTNVNLSFFDVITNSLSTGNTFNNKNVILSNVLNGNNITTEYKPNLYSSASIGVNNSTVEDTSSHTLGVKNVNARIITTDRDSVAGISLYSDTNTPIGTGNNVRGWNISKIATTGELSFDYQNSDLNSQGIVPNTTILNLDGVNNNVNIPASTLVFGGDTNLYRSAAGTLKTDNLLNVGSLTSNKVVITDSLNNLSVSSTTPTELDYLAGSTSNVQSQLNNKVNKSGDTMTGSLTLPVGSTASPALTFTGNTNSGLTGSGGNVSVVTSNLERLKVDNSGNITINQFTTSGLVHNNSTGILSSSLLVNADVSSSAAITDNKLATITTAGKVSNSATTATSSNTANTIVARDNSGNFTANVITANLIGDVTGSSSNNVLKSGDVMTGNLTLPSGSTSSPSLNFTGGINTGLSSNVNDLSINTNGVERLKVTGTGVVSVNNLTTTGVVHNDNSGVLTTSLIANNDILNNTISNGKLATISTTNVSGNIVVRDGSGNFQANMITLFGSPTNGTDAATKDYVDSAIMLGLIVLNPANVISTSNVALSGLIVIDGVTIVAGNRILLNGQTVTSQNGLWVAASGAWTRPTDFSTGSLAKQSYVLILSGTVNGQSSWICSTPTAVIGTNPINFILFSLPNSVNGANVGAGQGQLFQSKSGNTLQFKTILAGSNVAISNNSDTVGISTTSSSVSTPNVIVNRDASGNFSANTITANLIGNASGNVLKTGDSMTGTLNMLSNNEVRFNAASRYIGLKAPVTIPTSYTLSLPNNLPLANQTIRANPSTPTNLEWITNGSSTLPTDSRTIYVAKYGNDITGDGSLTSPYLTLSQGLSIANSIASPSNPVCIIVNPGIYVEDNSSGPLSLTASNISITGYASSSTVIMPAKPEITLLSIGNTTQIKCVTFMSSDKLADGLSFSSGKLTVLSGVRVINFGRGIVCSGDTKNLYGFNNCLFVDNALAIEIDDCRAELDSVSFFGSSDISLPPSNGALKIIGAGSNVVYFGGVIGKCKDGIITNKNSTAYVSSVSFKMNAFDVSALDSSRIVMTACSYEISDDPGDIDLFVSDPGTVVTIIGCNFNGTNIGGDPQGTGIVVQNGALVNFEGGSIVNYSVGIHVGLPSDTVTTSFSGLAIDINGCKFPIQQEGKSMVTINGSNVDLRNIIINDPRNVLFSVFDTSNNGSLAIGGFEDRETVLLQTLTSASSRPTLKYKPNLHSYKAIGYDNSNVSDSCLFNFTEGNSGILGLSNDVTKTSILQLSSDSGYPNSPLIRGWDIKKNAGSSTLSFNYQNADSNGLAIVPYHTVAYLDGNTDSLHLPSTAKLNFDPDVNLYRSSTGTLKTDTDFIVGTTTTSRALATDATNKLVSSATTAAELGYLSGVTSSIQPQITSKVNKSGDTMTGTLLLPNGTTSLPSLAIGNTGNGISCNSNNLSFSTTGVERLKINSAGVVSINGLSTTGVVHNNASGLLSTSLIVNADVSASAGIVDSKLATITTTGKVSNSATTATSVNTPSSIVLRDGSGNFSAGSITSTSSITGSSTISGLSTAGVVHNSPTGLLSTSLIVNADVSASAGIVDTKLATITTAGKVSNSSTTATSANTANTIVLRDGSGNFSASAITSTSSTVSNLSTAGVVHNNASGVLSTSLIVNVDVDPAASIADTKLATISTPNKVSNSATTAASINTANAIVQRNNLGGFEANQITLFGTPVNGTDVVTKSYVDVSSQSLLTPKIAVKVASFTNLTLSGVPATIDGIAISSGDRVILMNQSLPSQNGVWLVSAGSWTRPADWTPGTIVGSAYTLVTQGNTFANSGWVCITPSAVIGTNSLLFNPFSYATPSASTTVSGFVNTISQSFAGQKTFINDLSIPSGNLNAMTITTGSTINSGGTITAPDAITNQIITDSIVAKTFGGAVSFLSDVNGVSAIFSNIVEAGDFYTNGTLTANSNVNTGYLTANTVNTNTISPISGNILNISIPGYAVFSLKASGNNYTVLETAATAARSILLPDASDTLVGKSTTDVFANKTITGSSNNVEARSLSTTGASVSVNTSSPPVTGQVLTATSATISTWQSLPIASVSTNGLIDVNAQSFAGLKTFTNGISSNTIFTVSGNVLSISIPTLGTLNLKVSGSSTTILETAATANRTILLPDASDTLVGKSTTDIFANKTITGSSNNVEARSLSSTGASVSVNTSAPPSIGQVLIATSATAATWQSLPAAVIANITTAGIVDISTQSFGGLKSFPNGVRSLTGSNQKFGDVPFILITSGANNNAFGLLSMANLTSGSSNNAFGTSALNSITTVSNNSAFGSNSLRLLVNGNHNTSVGRGAGEKLASGNTNLFLGFDAGANMTGTSNNSIMIANLGVLGDTNITRIGSGQNKTFIAGISGKTTSLTAVHCVIDANGQLGTVLSLRELKDNIEDIDEEKNHTLVESLIPRKFTMKSNGLPSVGLIVDEVIDLDADLIAYDLEEKPYTVRYDQISILLLKEIQRSNKIIEKMLEREVVFTKKIEELQEKNGEMEAIKEEMKNIKLALASMFKV